MPQPVWIWTDVRVTECQHFVMIPDESQGVEQVVHLLSPAVGRACTDEGRRDMRMRLDQTLDDRHARVCPGIGDQEELETRVLELKKPPEIVFQPRVNTATRYDERRRGYERTEGGVRNPSERAAKSEACPQRYEGFAKGRNRQRRERENQKLMHEVLGVGCQV
jgi:hypothetical protein